MQQNLRLTLCRIKRLIQLARLIQPKKTSMWITLAMKCSERLIENVVLGRFQKEKSFYNSSSFRWFYINLIFFFFLIALDPERLNNVTIFGFMAQRSVMDSDNLSFPFNVTKIKLKNLHPVLVNAALFRWNVGFKTQKRLPHVLWLIFLKMFFEMSLICLLSSPVPHVLVSSCPARHCLNPRLTNNG